MSPPAAPVPGPAALRAVLDELAARGTRVLRREAAEAEMSASLRRAMQALVAVPVGVLLVQGMQVLAGAPRWQPVWPAVVGCMLLAPTLVLLAAFRRGWRAPVSRWQALGLFDVRAGAGERLVGADDLLADPSPSGFVQAALEDAAGYLGPARRVELTVRRPARAVDGPAAGLGVLAAALLAVLLLLGPDGEATLPPADAEVARGEAAPEPGPSPEKDPPEESDGSAPEEARATDRLPATVEPEERIESASDALPDEAPKKEGRTGSGRPSQAEPSRSAGDARGSPTGQSQQTKKPQRERKMKPAKKRKPVRTPPQPDQKKMEGEESGSTSGRGSSRGSNKNPVTSEWTSKDQVTTDEEEDVEDDDEVEDEEVDSEARGGVQPSLRDRKPPVSRDLTIGFGNNPNPAANGRGGPSQPKKSRGTASLVLGVPIPDRVKGRANPGKTKVTQERIEPRPEGAAPVSGDARLARSAPSGPLAQPDLPPWMRALIRDYFLGLRTKPKEPSK